MEIEFEATFLDINKEEVRKKLETIGAKLVKPEFMQRRYTFNLPKGFYNPTSWVRVRDEQDKITMTYKEVKGKNIKDQKEITLEINDLETGKEFLEKIGCRGKSYQETKRELWKIDGVEICIDTWPFLESFVEVEGKSEEKVKEVSLKLGFDYSKAFFASTTEFYKLKYGLSRKTINDKVPKIAFNMENPFIKLKKK
jgi:adenylate cyclase class 2